MIHYQIRIALDLLVAYSYGADGRALLAVAGSRTIYLIRNPLDVAVAFARHIQGIAAFEKGRTRLQDFSGKVAGEPGAGK